MKRKDLLLALLVVVFWGANFTVIKLGLKGVPSMVLAGARFMFTFFPACLLVKKPDISWKYIILFGLTMGLGQFSCLFYALEIGMPAGISSIVLQAQAFLTPLLAFAAFQEKMRRNQIWGLMIAAAGLILIGFTSGDHLQGVTIKGILFCILAAFFWATANVVIKSASNQAAKQEKRLDMFGVVIWSSCVSPIPFALLSLWIYPIERIQHAIISCTALSIFSVIYLVLFATIFGYGMWTTLLGKYSVVQVAPLSLLVPVFGLFTAFVVLQERLSMLQWMGTGIVMAGLLLLNGSSIFKKKTVR